MKPQDVLDYYETLYNFEKRTGIARASLRYWLRRGYMTFPSQHKIELLTDGGLKASMVDTREFNNHFNKDEDMNLRSMLKLTGCSVEECVPENPDNFYRTKISFSYGAHEMPRHGFLYFRDDELLALEKNLNLISEKLRAYLNVKQT